ncbi:MAG: hypothetical protein ABI843_18160 [Dokdonella sp.]
MLRPMVVFWRALDAGANEAMPRFRTNQETDLVAAAEGRHELALRMALQPGRYELIDINGLASAFPFIGNFSVPLFLELTVPPHSVTYVGHVSAQLRPRQDGEFRAGAVIPLVDQGVTGMAGGTFDVKVEDASATDLTMFRSTFPALGDTPIATAILPPFDRAKVQRRLGGKDDNVPSGGAATSH